MRRWKVALDGVGTRDTRLRLHECRDRVLEGAKPACIAGRQRSLLGLALDLLDRFDDVHRTNGAHFEPTGPITQGTKVFEMIVGWMIERHLDDVLRKGNANEEAQEHEDEAHGSAQTMPPHTHSRRRHSRKRPSWKQPLESLQAGGGS